MTADTPSAVTIEPSEAVERMALAIKNVTGGENYDYMDFCRDAARAAYDAAQITALSERLAVARGLLLRTREQMRWDYQSTVECGPRQLLDALDAALTDADQAQESGS